MKTKKLILTIMCLLTLSSLSYAQDSLECILQIECQFQGYPSNNIVGGGDINGDSYDDIVLSTRETAEYPTGYVYIYLGSSQPDTIPDYIITGETDYDYFGYAVSYTGDLNNDGYDDLVVSAPEYNNGMGLGEASWGRVYIYFGSNNFDIIPDIILEGTDYADDWIFLGFGKTVTTQGDFNNDGYDDLAVGSPGPSYYWNGQTDIFFGGEDMDIEVDWHRQGELLEGLWDPSLSAGDINGDNYDDIAIYISIPFTDLSKVEIYAGGEIMDTIPDATLINELSYQFGRYIAMDGDINNDSCNDLLISQSDPDQVNIYLGNQNLNLSCVYVLNYNNYIPNLFFANINNDQFSDIVVSKPTDH